MPESAKVPGGRSPVRFSRIEQPRTHVYLAEQLRREITLGVLPTGEALPPESPLWQQRSLQEHQRIFAGLEAGDPDAARRSMLAHVSHTARSLPAVLKAL